MIGLKDVHAARERIRKFIYRTPLVQSEWINAEFGGALHFKMENLQVTNAFKIRGSSNKMLQLTGEERKRGVIAASSGNHAQGFSRAAQQLGVNAVVVMPESAPANKVERCRKYGATVIIHGAYYDDSCRHARQLAREENRIYISSFDDEQVIAGNGTIALEVFEDLEDCDAIIAPIGGGGLISGIGVVAKTLNPKIEIIGVEAQGAPSMLKSLERGEATELESIATIADGIAVRRPGDINFEYARRFADRITLVSDEEILAAMQRLWGDLKSVVEPAGAASFAAATKLAAELKGRKTVCIVTGGNVDKDLYVRALNSPRAAPA